MTTPNPWNKRKSGPQEFMPPSRALLAIDKEGRKSTCVWCVGADGRGWICKYACRFLRFMRAETNPQRAKAGMIERGITWHWIEPNTVRVLEPPF